MFRKEMETTMVNNVTEFEEAKNLMLLKAAFCEEIKGGYKLNYYLPNFGAVEFILTKKEFFVKSLVSGKKLVNTKRLEKSISKEFNSVMDEFRSNEHAVYVLHVPNKCFIQYILLHKKYAGVHLFDYEYMYSEICYYLFKSKGLLNSITVEGKNMIYRFSIDNKSFEFKIDSNKMMGLFYKKKDIQPENFEKEEYVKLINMLYKLIHVDQRKEKVT